MDLPWRLLHSTPQSGAANMALDHALARCMTPDSAPVLRFYGWQPRCLSLGYFQPGSDVDMPLCQQMGIDVVRRPTGGRAILHADELTYALIAPATLPGLGGSVVDSYRTISAALLAGLARLGVPAHWTPPAAVSSVGGSAACFDRPADYEITVDGRKLIGSAQTRMRGVVLQHGSLLRSADVPLLSRVLRLDVAQSSVLARRLTALDVVLDAPPPAAALADALAAGFATYFATELRPDGPTDQELALATGLCAERYANPTWTARR